MREIKFRAWDKKRTIMIGLEYPDNWGDEKDEWRGDDPLLMLTGITDINKDERFKVMQYTGLKDKRGKNIYIGDIVKHEDPLISNVVAKFERMEVDAFEVYGCNIWGYIGDSDNLGKRTQSEWEVIGNIYEDENLLN